MFIYEINYYQESRDIYIDKEGKEDVDNKRSDEYSKLMALEDGVSFADALKHMENKLSEPDVFFEDKEKIPAEEWTSDTDNPAALIRTEYEFQGWGDIKLLGEVDFTVKQAGATQNN